MSIGIEAFFDELAAKVSERVLADLRRAPVVTQRLLSIEDAATMLGRSDKAVRHLVTSGQLPNSSGDGRVQIDIKDIEVWIKNNKR